MATTRRRRVSGLVALAAVTLSAVLASCGLDKKDVYADSQFIKCVYDHEDGQLVKTILPGGGREEVEDDAEVYLIPTSQRFYNVDPNRDIADPGAPNYVTGVESGYRPVQEVVHVKFYFNQAMACKFIDIHGKRNVPQNVLSDSDNTDKLGFNLRSDQQAQQIFGVNWAQAPWAHWLNENFAPVLQSQGEPLLDSYAWPYYEFKFPTNADINGILPCEPDQTDPDTGICLKTVPPAELAQDDLEGQMSTAFTEELYKQIGGKFFCGPGYDPSKPDACPPLGIEIVNIGLVDKAPVAARQEIINLREQAQNDAEEANLTEQSTQAAVDKRQAEIDQENQIAEINNAQAVAEATRQGSLQATQQANQLALDEAKATSEAKQKAALCTAMNATASECALLIAAANGQYPQGNNGTNITVTPQE